MNPYLLLIVRPTSEHIEIDLDEPQWMKVHAAWMRGEARWYLAEKGSRNVKLVVNVGNGDQPYCAHRHVRQMIGPHAGTEIVAYGLGAKRTSGQTDRLWLLPDGTVCGGDDQDVLLTAILDRGG